MEMVPYTQKTRLSHFLPLPAALLKLDLSGSAVLLYALLLDRGSLSRKNGYTGPGGQVFVVYPIPKLAAAMGKGTTIVKKRLHELEEAGLIRREVPVPGKASRIFLYLPPDTFCTGGRTQKRPGEGLKSDRHPVTKVSPNQQRKPNKRNQSLEPDWREESL